jgi:O-antigen ligase
MRTQIIDESSASFIRTLSLGAIALLPIVSLPISSDPFQPIRAAVLGLAIVAVAAASRTAHLPGLPYRRIAVVSIIVAGAGLLVSAVINGAASSVFGVAGRFQGLVSAIGIVGAVGVGLFVAPRVRDLTALLALAVSAEAVVVIAERLGSGAADGTSGNPVLSAGWLAVAVAVVAAGARTTRGRSAAVRWVAVVAGIAAIGMLGSRGAWLAVLLGLVPVLVSLKSRLRVIVVVGAAVMLVSAALAGGPETVAKLNPAALLRSSAAARTEILGGTTRLIAENPLVGVGPGRFLYEFTAYQTAEFAQIEPGDVRPDQAHSIPLQAAAEGGVPVALSGIALFAVALQAAWRGMRRREPSSLVVLSGLLAYAGQAVFGIGTIETDTLGFLLVGVALASTGSQAQATRLARSTLAGLGLLVLAASLFYIRADVAHLSGTEAFDRGDISSAYRLADGAVRQDPLVDVYRVALSDAAAYGSALQRTAALTSLERGLDLEPMSYDLALARARLLVRQGATADEVSDAYERAAVLYPVGIAVRREAIEAALLAGRTGVARALAEDVLAVLPDDEQARRVLERADASGP